MWDAAQKSQYGTMQMDHADGKRSQTGKNCSKNLSFKSNMTCTRWQLGFTHTRLFLMSFDGSNRVPYLYYSLPNFWVMCQKKKIIFFKISIVLSISNREKNKLYMDSWPPFRPSVFCSKYSIGKKRKPRIKRSLKNQKGKQKKCLELTLWSWFVGRMPGSPKFYRS